MNWIVNASVILVLLVVGSAAPAQNKEAQKTAPPEPEGMVKMSNGQDLKGWDGDTRLWKVKDGAIRGETTPENQTKGNTFLMYVGDAGPPMWVEYKDVRIKSYDKGTPAPQR